MKKSIVLVGAMALAAVAQADVTVGVDNDSSATWLGYMNVFELDGTTYAFGSSWGVPDLTAVFDDGAGTLTLGPNTIGDPNEYWYQGGRPGEDPLDPNDNGGPGAAGNKIMDASLYQQVDGGLYSGTTVTFNATILANTFTAAHGTKMFIKDFDAGYGSFNEMIIDITAPGDYSISLATLADPTRHVQWGFITRGVNVWATDVDPFGNVVVATVPTPASAALIGLGGLVACRRRR